MPSPHPTKPPWRECGGFGPHTAGEPGKEGLQPAERTRAWHWDSCAGPPRERPGQPRLTRRPTWTWRGGGGGGGPPPPRAAQAAPPPPPPAQPRPGGGKENGAPGRGPFR